MNNTPKFERGDEVTTKAGLPGIVRNVNTRGSAALVDTRDGDVFESSWIATGTLKRGHKAAKK